MKSATRLTCSLFVVVCAVAVIWGQRPPGPGRGGPGRAFGEPGGMPIPLVMLLRAAEVRAEIALRDDQQDQVDELIGEIQEELRASLNRPSASELGGEQRESGFEKARKKIEAIDAKGEQRVAKILDASQLERLNQLRLQREGLAAFGRAVVAKQLGLSEQQVAQIDKQRQQGLRPFGFGPPDFDELQAQQRQALEAARALLSEEQRTKWDAMTGREFAFQPPPFGRGGPGFGPGGPGFGPGGPMDDQERKIVERFDRDDNGWLNREERTAARESLASQDGRTGFEPRGRRGAGRSGPPGGRFGRGNGEPPTAGRQMTPEDVESYPDATLFEPSVLRTLFIDFEHDDWETELQDFKGSDVDVPATLTVDGKKYANVGVHFRGKSSYMMVPAGYKRSLNVSLDFVDEDQRLYGYKTLNLLNCHGDPSLMSSVLYSHVARQYIPAPKANFVRVVINGESWGVYANVQQFNKIFLAENYGSSKGTRWKVSGSPRADGGLRYLGDDIEQYKSRFEMKSNDGAKAWLAIIDLCRTLNETPLDQLEQALEPILDIENVLWFLAVDVALVNSDGYWTRASDYSLFRDENGMFHIIPHDMNEAFRAARGPSGPGAPGAFGPPGGFGPPPGAGLPGGFGPLGSDSPPPFFGGGRRPGERGRGNGIRPPGRGPGRAGFGGPMPGSVGRDARGSGGFELDPLVGLDDPRMPLRSRLLAVPNLRAKYLEHVRQLAETSLDWKNLGPVVAQCRQLIKDDVKADTRKLETFEAFEQATSPATDSSQGQGRQVSLRSFAIQRRKFLLEYEEPKEEKLPTGASADSSRPR